MSNEKKSLKSKNPSENEHQSETNYITPPEQNIPEKKKYINLYICQLSVGIIFTYIFIICSITINIVNRVIFWKYKFKFNFTLILLQQLFCMIFFSICSQKSQIFIEQTGGISFSDFWKLKYQYIGYCLFFILKTVTSFLGYQLVTNITNLYTNKIISDKCSKGFSLYIDQKWINKEKMYSTVFILISVKLVRMQFDLIIS